MVSWSLYFIAFVLATLSCFPTFAEAGFTVHACFQLAGKGVNNALVRCYDSDWGTDDRIGRDTRTDSNGCVAVYDNQRWYERPDVYCKVYANGECFATTTTRILDDRSSSSPVFLGTTSLSYDGAYCGNFRAGGNGCGPSSLPSWLRDVATSVSGFRSQCAVHDACYSQCSISRSECDDDFYEDMLLACNGGWTCDTLAYLFFQAVDEFGGSACRSARLGSCSSTALCSR